MTDKWLLETNITLGLRIVEAFNLSLHQFLGMINIGTTVIFKGSIVTTAK